MKPTGTGKLDTMNINYKELQAVLKSAKLDGLSNIALNSSKVVLQAEYDRLQNCRKDFIYQIEKLAEVIEVDKEQVIEFCKYGNSMSDDIAQLAESQNISYDDMVDKINETYRIFCFPKSLQNEEFTMLEFIGNKLYLSQDEARKELGLIEIALNTSEEVFKTESIRTTVETEVIESDIDKYVASIDFLEEKIKSVLYWEFGEKTNTNNYWLSQLAHDHYTVYGAVEHLADLYSVDTDIFFELLAESLEDNNYFKYSADDCLYDYLSYRPAFKIDSEIIKQRLDHELVLTKIENYQSVLKNQ